MKVLLVAVNDYVTLAVLQSLAVESIRADIISPQDMRFFRLSRYSNKYMFCQIDDLFKADASFAERIDHYCTFAGVNFAVLGISTVLQRPELPEIKYQTGLCLPEQVIEKSLLRLFLQKQISLGRNAFRYLASVLCDPLVLAERIRKRLAKIFIPQKIRHRRPKLVILPLSAFDSTPQK